MPTLDAVVVTSPELLALLDEFYAMRSAGFPGTYTTSTPDEAEFTPPVGVFLLVRDDTGAAVGCGGIRRIASDGDGVRYEVKHLFLQSSTRGRGWGRMLLDGLERQAREWGATELVLDTHHTLEAAGGLYATSGFTAIAPYNDNPNATRWYGKAL